VNRSLCTCPTPHRGYRTENRPRGDQFCVCGGYIDPSWCSNDKTMGEIYDRLTLLNREVVPHPATGEPTEVVTEIFDQFRIEALAREFAGRDKFGLRFLGRDNIRDGWEEATDGANYAAFEIIKSVNRRGDDSGEDYLLRAMQKFFEAYELLAEARRALKGSP
jgi:hypothetical protein